MQAQKSLNNSHIFLNGGLDDPLSRSREASEYATIQISSSSSSSSSSDSLSPSSSLSPYGDHNFIEHRVSKMDTLAGVAIKYGVEVADIKRMNGLVTDNQMFAHNSLQIPLPGRHPPSPVKPNGSAHIGEKTPPLRTHDDIFNSLQSLKLKPSSRSVSPAMCSLQSKYSLKQSNKGLLSEGTEMAVYKSGKPLLSKNETLLKTPASDSLYGKQRKSQSLVNFISIKKGDITVDLAESDRSIRRRQKTCADSSLRAPEILNKEENTGGFSGKGMTSRPKPGFREDLDECCQNLATGSDYCLADVLVSVRESSSTTSLSEFENSYSIWPTSKWSLKADVIARPVIDGLSKPITAWRNKTALD